MDTTKDRFTFSWQIENFRVLTNAPIDLDSPIFHAHQVKWFLRMHTSAETVEVSLCRSPETNKTPIIIGIYTDLISGRTINLENVDLHETSSNSIFIEKIPVERLKTLLLRYKDLQVKCTIISEVVSKTPVNIPLLQGSAAKEEYCIIQSAGKSVAEIRPSVSQAVTRILVMKSTVVFDIPPLSAVNEEKSFYLESSLQDWVSLQISVLRKPRVDQMLVKIRRVVLDYSKWTFIQIFSHLVDRLEGIFYQNSFQHCFVGNPDYTWELSVDIFSSSKTRTKRRKINKAIKKNPGCLRIYLEMLISQEGCYHHSRQDTECPIDTSTPYMQKDLGNTLNEKSQDTYLLVSSDGQNVPVHGYILREKSSVFDKMLTYAMQERKHRKINLQLDKTATEVFVTFLYSGNFEPKTTKVACSLLSVAHMYQVTGLMELCKDFLIYNPTFESVFDVLRTAIILEDSMLFESTRKFLVLRAVEAFHSQEWMLFDWNPWLKLKFSTEILREAMQYRDLDSLIDLLKRRQRTTLLEN